MECAKGADADKVLASGNAASAHVTHSAVKDPVSRGRLRRGGLLRRTMRLAKDERGASALEFAFVLPFLLLLLTGMVDAGVLLLTQHNMFRVAQNSARNFALGTMSEQETECYARDQLSNLGGTLSVDAEPPVAPSTDIIVTITVPIADVVPIDVVGITNTLFQSGTLQSQVTMRQEVAAPVAACI